MSIPADKKSSRIRILAVIGIAVIGLFVSLFAISSLGMSITNLERPPGEESPMSRNDKQVLAKRMMELPEVQTFLHIYPNATIEDRGNSGTSADYAFSVVKSQPKLDERIGLWQELVVGITTIPDQKDIQAGRQKQFGEYYYSATLYCSPANLDDLSQSWFPNRLWEKSRALCPSEKTVMKSTLIVVAS